MPVGHSSSTNDPDSSSYFRKTASTGQKVEGTGTANVRSGLTIFLLANPPGHCSNFPKHEVHAAYTGKPVAVTHTFKAVENWRRGWKRAGPRGTMHLAVASWHHAERGFGTEFLFQIS